MGSIWNYFRKPKASDALGCLVCTEIGSRCLYPAGQPKLKSSLPVLGKELGKPVGSGYTTRTLHHFLDQVNSCPELIWGMAVHSDLVAWIIPKDV